MSGYVFLRVNGRIETVQPTWHINTDDGVIFYYTHDSWNVDIADDLPPNDIELIAYHTNMLVE